MHHILSICFGRYRTLLVALMVEALILIYTRIVFMTTCSYVFCVHFRYISKIYVVTVCIYTCCTYWYRSSHRRKIVNFYFRNKQKINFLENTSKNCFQFRKQMATRRRCKNNKSPSKLQRLKA